MQSPAKLTHIKEQIESLRETGMQEIIWDTMNQLNTVKDSGLFVQTTYKQRQLY